MRLLAAKRFGSQIFATFANGYAYEYAPGVPLNYELCIDPTVYPLVARKLGEMHRELRVEMLPRPSQKSGHIFDTLRSWLEQIPSNIKNRDTLNRMKRELPSKLALARELRGKKAMIINWWSTRPGYSSQIYGERTYILNIITYILHIRYCWLTFKSYSFRIRRRFESSTWFKQSFTLLPWWSQSSQHNFWSNSKQFGIHRHGIRGTKFSGKSCSLTRNIAKFYRWFRKSLQFSLVVRDECSLKCSFLTVEWIILYL